MPGTEKSKIRPQVELECVVRGELIRKTRNGKLMTVIELAKLAELDERTIRRMEKGQQAKVGSLRRVADALGIDYEKLIVPQEPSSPDEVEFEARIDSGTPAEACDGVGVAPRFLARRLPRLHLGILA